MQQNDKDMQSLSYCTVAVDQANYGAGDICVPLILTWFRILPFF